MPGPFLLAENLWSRTAFPGHLVTASEQDPNHTQLQIGNGRRASANYITAITPNLQWTLTLNMDRLRGSTAVFLERGHNLAGVQVFWEVSFDGTSYETIASPTIPPVSTPGMFSNTNGIVLEDGAWGMSYAYNASKYLRLRVPAMGSGLMPVVTNIYQGLAYEPAQNFLTPWDEDGTDLTMKETVSEWAWRGRGPAGISHTGTINMKMLSDEEYDVARYHILGHFGRSRPMWMCYDQEGQADRTFLAIRPGGHMGIGFMPNWWPRQGQVPYVEHEPLRI